jgi:hypothetical protein
VLLINIFKRTEAPGQCCTAAHAPQACVGCWTPRRKCALSRGASLGERAGALSRASVCLCVCLSTGRFDARVCASLVLNAARSRLLVAPPVDELLCVTTVGWSVHRPTRQVRAFFLVRKIKLVGRLSTT